MLPIAPSVILDPYGGTYEGSQSISLNSEIAATIFASFDGSSFFEYEEPIELLQVSSFSEYNYTIRARSEAIGYLPSNVTEAAYQIQTKLLSPVCNIPFGVYYNETTVSCSCKLQETIKVMWNGPESFYTPALNSSSETVTLLPIDTETLYQLQAKCERENYAASNWLEGEFSVLQFR